MDQAAGFLARMTAVSVPRNEQATWAAAVRRGLTLDELAEEMGTDRAGAKEACRRFGLTPRQPAPPPIPPAKVKRRLAELEVEEAPAAAPLAPPVPEPAAPLSDSPAPETPVSEAPVELERPDEMPSETDGACTTAPDGQSVGAAGVGRRGRIPDAEGQPGELGCRGGVVPAAAGESPAPEPERPFPTKAELRRCRKQGMDARAIAKATGFTAAEIGAAMWKAGIS